MVKMSRKDLMMLVLSVSLVTGAVLASGCIGKEIQTPPQTPTQIIEDITPLEAFAPIQESQVCMVYFTGIGCLHCARADPVVLEQLPREYPNLVIIEYEIYEQEQNAPVLDAYNDEYYSGYVIPLIIFNQDQYLDSD